MSGHTPRMNGSRRARTALTRALTSACVVLLCVFGAGPAAATAAEPRPAAGAPAAPAAPAEPSESPSDPAAPADPEVRAAVRALVRGVPGVRRTPLRCAAHPVEPARAGRPAEPAGPGRSPRTVRSVVLRC